MECYGKKNALELFQLHDLIFYILEISEDILQEYSDKGRVKLNRFEIFLEKRMKLLQILTLKFILNIQIFLLSFVQVGCVGGGLLNAGALCE